MESPFRSEAAAFRLLLVTIGAFALIVAARGSLVARPPHLRRPDGRRRLALPSPAAARASAQAIEHVGAPDERRVLVVANETVGGEELMSAISELALSGKAEFFVVCPALNSRLKTWTSDETRESAGAGSASTRRSPASRRSGSRLAATSGTSTRSSRSRTAMRLFRPDEIVVSSDGRSNWLERGVVAPPSASMLDVPVTHVVVDLKAHGPGSELGQARGDGDVTGRSTVTRSSWPTCRLRAGDVLPRPRDLAGVERVLERRHRALPVRHAVDDESFGGPRCVEVQADRAGGPRIGERVARSARLREDRLPVHQRLRGRPCPGHRSDVRGDVRGLLLVVDANASPSTSSQWGSVVSIAGMPGAPVDVCVIGNSI